MGKNHHSNRSATTISLPHHLPARQANYYNEFGGGCPTIAKIKEETCGSRSPPTLLYIPFLAPTIYVAFPSHTWLK